MKNKLEEIFIFLKENRKYNKKVQTNYYQSILGNQNSKFEKIISLLYHVVSTQSSPSINRLAPFYRKIYEDENCVNSFKSFIDKLNPKENQPYNYETLFECMKEQNGWGNKTSALFAKTIYHLHNGNYPKEFEIWDDAPKTLETQDTFFLPVDSVIIAIFTKIDPNTSWDFEKINDLIKNHNKGKGTDIEIWDDLWFWGFISQHGSKDRDMGWNENKYWILRETDKNQKIIDEEIIPKVKIFIEKL